jgi:hypothetical protein
MLAKKERRVQQLREELELAKRIRDPEEFNPTFKPHILKASAELVAHQKRVNGKQS